MQISTANSSVISRFWLLLSVCVLLPISACATDAGLPDDIMTEQKPVEAVQPTPPPKVSTKKETERNSKEAAAPEKKSAKTEKAKDSKVVAPSVDTEALKRLKTLDARYQSAKSIAMDVERNLIMGMLGKEKKAKGTLLLSKGRMRMELNDPEKSLIVIDGKTLWVADYPPAEFKNAAVQVLKGKVSSKKGASQGFVGLLTRGGVLSQFNVTGALTDRGGRSVYFLQPKAATVEFKRAQLTISADQNSIESLQFWDERDNETKLTFSNVKFDQKVDAKTFEFTPPENADVTSI